MTTLYRYWRLLGTGFSFALFGIGAFSLALVIAPLVTVLPGNTLSKRRFARKAVQLSAWFYVRVMRNLKLLSFRISGAENLQQPGTLVIANHPSLLDAVFLMSVMPQACFVAKAAMARHPATRWIVQLAGYIANDGEGLALVERAALALREGETLVIFPEGTRGSSSVLNLKRGAANIALAAGCPIIPVHISCNPSTLRKGEAWYAIPSSPPHFSLEVLAPIKAELFIESTSPAPIQARRLTQGFASVLGENLQANTKACIIPRRNPRNSG